MASLDHLSRTQKILLAILCFPLLPFYLCYICCCSDNNDVDKAKQTSHNKKENVEKGRDDSVDGLWNRAKIHPNKNTLQTDHREDARSNANGNIEKGNKIRKPEVVYENHEIVQIHTRNETLSLSKTFSFGKGNKIRKPEVVHENEATVQIHARNETPSLSKKFSFGKGNKIRKPEVEYEKETVQVHMRKETPRLSKKNSFGKGNNVRKDEVVYENEGYVHDENKTPDSNTGPFTYPWNESNLKSMRIDLNRFKKVDAYASKLKARGSVEELVQDLLKGANTEIDKLRAIWMWVTHHIAYDIEGLRNPKLRSGSPEEVLRTGKGVCAGYAVLFQQMCSLAGLECKEVSGYSKGGSYTPGKRFSGDATHAWNAVQLAGRWHLLDSTWGAGNTNYSQSHFKFKYNEFYFLTHPALFVGDHFPQDQEWQLIKPQVSLKEFENALHRRSWFYGLGLLSSYPESWLIQSDGKTTITIRSSSPRVFLQDLNGEKNHGILTLRPDGMKLEIYPPKVGKHSLNIYCRDPDSADEMYHEVLTHELQCKAVNNEMRFSDKLLNPVGPSWLSEKNGLREPSQRDAVVHTVDGRCSFSFCVDSHHTLMAMLTAGSFTMTDDQQRRHTLKTLKGDCVDFSVQVPKPGLYQLCIYGKDKPEVETYSYICSYLISCTNPKVRWPVYPLQYASWQENYELVEPYSGVLPANREIWFKLKVPGVSQVSVQGQRTHDLKLGSDGFWTGSCNTTGCVDLPVKIRKNPNDQFYSFILNYEVENN